MAAAARSAIEDVVLDVEKLLKDIEADRSRFDDSSMGKPRKRPTIHRVGAHVREQEGGRDVYDPWLVAIGPYHRHDEALKPMQSVKLLYLNDLLCRTPEHKSSKLMECIKAVSKLEAEARDQYAGGVVDMEKEEFVKMLVLDGCFVLEALIKSGTYEKDGSPLADLKWNERNLRRDLLLMENQIPFFIVDVIHKITCGGGEAVVANDDGGKAASSSINCTDCLLEKAIVFLSRGSKETTAAQLPLLTGYGESGGADPRAVDHLLHLSHLFHLRGLTLFNEDGSAVDLKEKAAKDQTTDYLTRLRSMGNSPGGLLLLAFRVLLVHLPRIILIGLVYAIMLPFLLLMGKPPSLFRAPTTWDELPRMIPSAAELIERGSIDPEKGQAQRADQLPGRDVPKWDSRDSAPVRRDN